LHEAASRAARAKRGKSFCLETCRARGFVVGVLFALLTNSSAPTFLNSLADYPRWLVVACTTIVLAAAIWVTMKLLKVALWLLIFAVLAMGLGTAAWLLVR